MSPRRLSFAAIFTIAVSSVACGEDDLPNAGPPIGSAAYDQTGMCKVDSDCQRGESCTVTNNVGLCVMKRCAGNNFQATAEPLPAQGFMVEGRELRLKEPPKVVSGALVPLAVLIAPPYSKTYSGDFRGGVKSSVTFSNTASKTDGTSSTETKTDSITITSGWAVDVSLGPSVGPQLHGSFEKQVNDRLGTSVTKSTDFAVTTSIGQNFTFDVRPEIDGYDSGAIVVGCGCYNQYVYDVEDPNAADGGTVKVNIPIGGQTSLWSLRRYNQLAEATKGGLPIITGGPKIGDIDSYPTTLVGIDGKPIPNADLVFGPENTATFPVSDTGTSAFTLEMSKSRTDSTQTADERAHGWSYGGSIGLGVNTPIVNVSGKVTYNKAGEVNTSIGKGYSVTLANTTSFSGTVPFIKDNPATPEDEFKAHGYGFTPYVYRAHYETPEKNPAAYFVITYTVDKN
jgi:hypothetical protein